jgi:uncharacterized membrane protein YfcA
MAEVILGAVFGLLSGIGVGGGTILIPAMVLFMGTEQHVAQGASLLAFLPASIFSLVIHIKNKQVRFDYALPLIVSGVAGSIAGALVSSYIPVDLLRKCFGGFLVVLAVWQGWKAVKK